MSDTTSDFLIINTDGGARGNPGPAASAYIIKKANKVIKKDARYIGETTNNVAEYKALILALDWLVKNKKFISENKIKIFMDSELIVKQLTGLYKIKSENLFELNKAVNKLIESLDRQVSFVHVPREFNKDADFLVNSCLDYMKV